MRNLFGLVLIGLTLSAAGCATSPGIMDQTMLARALGAFASGSSGPVAGGQGQPRIPNELNGEALIRAERICPGIGTVHEAWRRDRAIAVMAGATEILALFATSYGVFSNFSTDRPAWASTAFYIGLPVMMLALPVLWMKSNSAGSKADTLRSCLQW